jgi:hypothetical protein
MDYTTAPFKLNLRRKNANAPPQCYVTRTSPFLLYIFGVYTCQCDQPRGLMVRTSDY